MPFRQTNAIFLQKANWKKCASDQTWPLTGEHGGTLPPMIEEPANSEPERLSNKMAGVQLRQCVRNATNLQFVTENVQFEGPFHIFHKSHGHQRILKGAKAYILSNNQYIHINRTL